MAEVTEKVPAARFRRGPVIAWSAGLLGFLLLGGAFLASWAHIRSWYLLRASFERVESSSSFPEYRHLETGIVMVLLPGGTFTMGGEEDAPGAMPHEHPRHEVTLDPFLIAKHEVSQEEWERAEGQRFFLFPGPRLPAHGLSWIEARSFCDERGLALPTEAQWEYACRAARERVSARAPSTGDGAALPGAREAVRAVSNGRANAFGLVHMQGNVEEWCEDTYVADFYSRPEASARNPVSRELSDSRVARGGSFQSTPEERRAASRNPLPFSTAGWMVGFRPVFNLR